MGPKVYTVQEATALIPQLETFFSELDVIRERVRKAKGKLDVLQMIWGEELASSTCPDRREYEHYTKELDLAKQAFDSLTSRLGELEVSLKSIETGLIDFYGVMEGHLVFLCWKRGEKRVNFYHHLEDGFEGRREIDAAHQEPSRGI